MRWALTRGVVIGVAGLLMGAVACAWIYSMNPALAFELDRDPPRVVTGLYPVESDPAGLTFAWSRERVEIDLPGLNRRGDWRLTVVARGARPAQVPQPTILVDVDGVTVATAEATNAFTTLEVPIPAHEGVGAGARVVIRASSTFSPGADDPRQLGLQVDAIRLDHPEVFGVLPPRSVLLGGAFAAALAAAAFGFIRVTAGSAIVGAGLVALGQAVVLCSGSAPFGGLARRAVLTTAALALSLVVGIWYLEWRQGGPLRNTARFVGVFSVVATYLKLLVLWHPDIDVRDALFQAHRFEFVLAGRYFFTSIAPGNYEFPYAIALYLVASPFRVLASNATDLMDVLRAVVAITDGVAAIVLYPLLLRAGASRLAGAVAVAVYHLLPLNFAIQWVANQTNAFGQSVFLLAVAALAFSQARMGTGPAFARALAITATAAGFAVAFLAHTSSAAIGGVFLSVLAVLLATTGSHRRADALRIVVVVIIAAAVSWWAYYSRFWDVYLAQYARISGEVAQPAAVSDPGGRSILDRALAVPRYVYLYFGAPAALLAAIGLAEHARARRRDMESLVLWAWLATCLGFLVLGVLTPVDMRHYLAALPAVAWLVGLATDRLWGRGRLGRAVAVTLLLWISGNGIAQWLEPLGR